MSIVLNHTIVPAHDKEAAARFFAHIFGLSYDGLEGNFAPVRVNADSEGNLVELLTQV